MFVINSSIIKLHGAAESLQGGRPDNQDDLGFLDTPLGFLFIVCDGMGGGPGGKTASYIAKYEIAKTLSECNPHMPRDKAFKMAVSKANDALEEKMEQVPNLRGMGSTFVAVLINSESAMIAYAGDSRCYRLHGRHVLFRTKDHSLVGELVRQKALTEEQARTSPQSNVISRGLGCVSNHVPDIYEVPYRKGDRFILCTDGVWGVMPQKELIKRFAKRADCQQVVGQLSLEIDNIGRTKGGHYDNHTLALIEMDSNSTKKDKWLFWAFGSIAALALVALLVIVMAILKNTDSGTSASVKMNENLYPKDVLSKAPVVENNESLKIDKFVNMDSLVKVHKDSLNKTDTTKTKAQKNKSKLNAHPKADYTKAIELTQQVLNRLDSLMSFCSKNEKETKETRIEYINNVKYFLDQLQNLNILDKYKKEGLEIKKDVESNSNTLFGYGRRHNGTYQSLPNANNKVKEIKIKVVHLNKGLKDGNN